MGHAYPHKDGLRGDAVHAVGARVEEQWMITGVAHRTENAQRMDVLEQTPLFQQLPPAPTSLLTPRCPAIKLLRSACVPPAPVMAQLQVFAEYWRYPPFVDAHPFSRLMREQVAPTFDHRPQRRVHRRLLQLGERVGAPMKQPPGVVVGVDPGGKALEHPFYVRPFPL